MKKILLALAAMVSMVFIAGSVMAAEKPLTPATLQGVTVVDDSWVKTNHGKMKVFDVRKKAEYIEAHIPGAISVPYDEKSEHAVNFDAKRMSLTSANFLLTRMSLLLRTAMARGAGNPIRHQSCFLGLDTKRYTGTVMMALLGGNQRVILLSNLKHGVY